MVIAQVDKAQALEMLKNVSWPLLGLAVVFLFLEGVATALRLWLFAGKKSCLSETLKANAWYVLLLVILPARLGEVGAIEVLKRYLGQKYGAAAMSIIAQRLYDVVVLGVIFVIALLGLGPLLHSEMMYLAAIGIIVFALLVLARLDLFLTITVLILGKDRGTGLMRKLKRLVLQARTYARHGLKRSDIFMALTLTLMKWLSNLGALVFLFLSLHLGLSFFENVTVAGAYNFLAIIPLQTVGGIGVGEIGLTLLLVSMGLATSMAAGASLMIRFVIVVFPFLFFAFVFGGLKIKQRIGL